MVQPLLEGKNMLQQAIELLRGRNYTIYVRD